MPGIGVVTNPRSRRNRQNPALVQRLAYILGDHGRLDQPEDAAGMEAVARLFLEREIDVLCINGGDGTAHVVLSAFAAVYGERPLPMLALLRGGTMNTVSHGLGIRGTPSELLARVVEGYHQGEPFPIVERNLLCVDGRNYGFLFGNGLVSNFLEAYYEGSEPSPWKAARLVVQAVLSGLVKGRLMKRLLQPVEAEVTLDGRKWPARRYATIAAGTVNEIGLGFAPFYAAPRHPGWIHCLGFDCPAMAIVRELPRIRRGLPTRNPDIHDQLARTIRISASRPLAYQVDGDFHMGGQTLEITVGPRVRLVVPERARRER